MLRAVDHIGDRSDLGNPAGVHHSDAIRGLGDHAHVVRDEHHRRAVVAAEPLQERDDLRLDRYVQCGGRFIGDNEFGIRRERQRDHDALPHAAGELVRIMIEAARGRGDADLGQKITRALVRRRGCQVEMRHDRLDELAADRIQRVERSQRILEYRADFASTDPAHGFGREFVYAPTVEPDFTGADSSRWVDEPDDRRTGERFAGARFPNHPQHFAGRDGE